MSFKLLQVEERLLKGLLGDIFGIFRDAREAPGNGANPRLVPFDKDFKRVVISGFCSCDKRCIFFVRWGAQKSDRSRPFVVTVYKLWGHSISPSSFLKSVELFQGKFRG